MVFGPFAWRRSRDFLFEHSGCFMRTKTLATYLTAVAFWQMVIYSGVAIDRGLAFYLDPRIGYVFFLTSWASTLYHRYYIGAPQSSF